MSNDQGVLLDLPKMAAAAGVAKEWLQQRADEGSIAHIRYAEGDDKYTPRRIVYRFDPQSTIDRIRELAAGESQTEAEPRTDVESDQVIDDLLGRKPRKLTPEERAADATIDRLLPNTPGRQTEDEDEDEDGEAGDELARNAKRVKKAEAQEQRPLLMSLSPQAVPTYTPATLPAGCCWPVERK
jgi:hypothetical protein